MSDILVNGKAPGIPGDWLDLRGKEIERTYHLPGGDYTIKEPVLLLRRETGTHRIIDAAGRAHMIDPTGQIKPISFVPPADAKAYFVA